MTSGLNSILVSPPYSPAATPENYFLQLALHLTITYLDAWWFVCEFELINDSVTVWFLTREITLEHKNVYVHFYYKYSETNQAPGPQSKYSVVD